MSLTPKFLPPELLKVCVEGSGPGGGGGIVFWLKHKIEDNKIWALCPVLPQNSYISLGLFKSISQSEPGLQVAY